jgi:hypothetical protein
MTRSSVREYAAAVRPRYLAASKRERGQILTEFCRTTGYHRKAAVRLLRRPPSERRRQRRPRQYGGEVTWALKQVWEAADRPCSKRLAPFLPELVAGLERHGELAVTPEVRAALGRLSPATIDRLLRPHRTVVGRRPFSQGRAPAALQAQVAIRTFGEWGGVRPGAVQADLVSHCGDTTEGFYLTTLTVVDVATGWVELEPVWGKGQQRVGGALHRVRLRLPMGLRELHTDNGGEFLNGVLYPYCRRAGIRFTRGRPYKKNDQAYVEQKNWAAVRRMVGYARYSSKAAYAQLGRVYEPLRRYVNFFQPIRKLVSKERVGAKVVKRYDRAQTPYQRLLASGVLDEAQRQGLDALYHRLNPLQLLAEIDAALATLGTLAERDRRPAVELATACGDVDSP